MVKLYFLSPSPLTSRVAEGIGLKISPYMDLALAVDHAEMLIRVDKNYIRTKFTHTYVVLICLTYST